MPFAIFHSHGFVDGFGVSWIRIRRIFCFCSEIFFLKAEFQRKFKEKILPRFLTVHKRLWAPWISLLECHRPHVFKFSNRIKFLKFSFAEILHYHQKTQPNFNFHHVLSLRFHDSFVFDKALEMIENDMNKKGKTRICALSVLTDHDQKKFHANVFS